MMTQTKTVFTTRTINETLVVTPQGDSTGFRYNDIHAETNAIITLIGRQKCRHLVIDFGSVEIVGSIMISAIIKLARRITSHKGQAAFCCASETMQDVMQSMNLTRLWPCFDSLEDAISSFKSET